ncbi:MAG: glycosyltransferase [Chthoniobacteraceae bacterium]
MPQVLILTAGYGEGHNAAARGLHAACAELGLASEIGDCFTALGPAYDRSRRQYLALINRAPKIWAAAFGMIDRFPIVEFSLPALAPVRQALSDLLREKQPSVVVSVYPAYGYLLAQIFPAGTSRPFTLHTVVTDSITINRVWHRCPSDTFIVPNAASAAVMREQGVPSSIIHDLGFPVPPRFARDRPLRPAPGSGQKGRVLYMINAGKEMAPATVASLLEVEGIELTVTVGRDEELRRKIEVVAAGRALSIYGWTPQMPELLMSHHVLIGKAGGATVQEAIAAETPMLITQVVPGQEEGNAQLMFENQCAALCPTTASLAEKVGGLFRDDAGLWRQWATNISRLSRPAAALDIARFVSSQDASLRDDSNAPTAVG